MSRNRNSRTTLARRTARRMPSGLELKAAGVSRKSLVDALEDVRGVSAAVDPLRYMGAVDSLMQAGRGSAVAARAGAALAMEMVTDVMRERGLFGAYVCQVMISAGMLGTDPVAMRRAWQLLNQAERDAAGAGGPDRFEEFVGGQEVGAMRALMAALIVTKG